MTSVDVCLQESSDRCQRGLACCRIMCSKCEARRMFGNKLRGRMQESVTVKYLCTSSAKPMTVEEP